MKFAPKPLPIETCGVPPPPPPPPGPPPGPPPPPPGETSVSSLPPPHPATAAAAAAISKVLSLRILWSSRRRSTGATRCFESSLSGYGRSVDARSLAQDARRHEDQELGVVVDDLPAAEQVSEAGDVAEDRDLVDGISILGLVDAAEDDGLAVVDGRRRHDGARVGARHDAPGRARHDLADLILRHYTHHDDHDSTP